MKDSNFDKYRDAAYPGGSYPNDFHHGVTKLELFTLGIAQSMLAGGTNMFLDQKFLVGKSISLAKALLDELDEEQTTKMPDLHNDDEY